MLEDVANVDVFLDRGPVEPHIAALGQGLHFVPGFGNKRLNEPDKPGPKGKKGVRNWPDHVVSHQQQQQGSQIDVSKLINPD